MARAHSADATVQPPPLFQSLARGAGVAGEPRRKLGPLALAVLLLFMGPRTHVEQ